MIGRERELTALATSQGPVLLLRGEAGVGKTALLAAVSAEGFKVLRATGVEAETAIAYAGLHQLLHPLTPLPDGLDPGHRATLEAVLDGTPAVAPSVMALGVAVLDLLSVGPPLLLIVDDGQWFDVPSIQVLTFVARRLGDLPVRLLVAVREGVPSLFDEAGLEELAVSALSAADAADLLDSRFPDLPAEHRRLVLEHAAGNPLALVELPSSIAEGLEPGFVPLPRRLERVFASRIRALTARERAELLRLALDGAGRHGSGSRYVPRDVETARATGLLEQGRLAFRHPLVASAVVQLASPNERAAAHADLAALYEADLERRAVHLAAATIDPDTAVAAALEEAARSAVRRGGAATAVQWLTRAAELSPRPADRARLLGDAGFVAGQAGLLERAQVLVAAADRADGRIASPDAVLTAAYVALYRHGDVSMHGVVANVLRQRHTELDDAMLARIVHLLLAISQFAADAPTWRVTDELVELIRDRLPATTLLLRDAWSDVAHRGAGLRERIREAVAANGEAEPWELMRLGVAAFYADSLADLRPYLGRMMERERETGAVTSVMTMLQLTVLDDIAAGRWDDAVRGCTEGLTLTSEHGYELFGHQFRVFLGLVAAQRGDTARAAALQAEVEAWARPRKVGFLLQFAEDLGMLAALSSGDYETAWAYASGITTPGAFPAYAQHAPRTLLDLVEAALHTGRDDLASAHAAAAASLRGISPRLDLLIAGALAMTSPSAEAFAAASQQEFPFEWARVRLAEGVWCRRQKRITEARAALTAALTTFEQLGAESWATRTRQELRAGAPSTASLTAQERHIAELAATGLSNKQIGAQLFLSPRTVGAHLYRIFPKLGITSRAALRDALESPG
ncbi:LuxR C-terminal-related transcriptional regulator [Actinoplanes sp. CA-054009]